MSGTATRLARLPWLLLGLGLGLGSGLSLGSGFLLRLASRLPGRLGLLHRFCHHHFLDGHGNGRFFEQRVKAVEHFLFRERLPIDVLAR